MSTNIIHTVKNRESGSTISIAQIENAKDGYGWAAQCEHGAQLKTNTRRQAHEAGRKPSAWCATCKKGAPKATVKKAAPAKRAAAKKTVAKKAPAKRKARA